MQRLLWIPVIAVFAGLLAYGYGLFTVYQLRQATAAGDTAALARLVDWTALQADLAEAARSQSPLLQDQPGGPVAAAIAALPAGEQTLGRLMAALAPVVRCQEYPAVAGYQSLTLACGMGDTPLATVHLTLLWDQARWRVTALTLADGIYGTIAQQEPLAALRQQLLPTTQ